MAGEFNDQFIFGLAIGVLCVSMVLYRFSGMAIGQLYDLNIAFSPQGQFHLITIDLFLCLLPINYWLLKGLTDNGKRVLASALVSLLVFSLHDVAWLIETFWVPQIYKGGLIVTGISIQEYIYHFSKNLISIIPCLAFLVKWRVFKPNYLAGIAFAGMFLFHIYNIVFQVNLYVLNGSALLVMELIDVAPYLFLLKARANPYHHVINHKLARNALGIDVK